jgi:hypothetical protein
MVLEQAREPGLALADLEQAQDLASPQEQTTQLLLVPAAQAVRLDQQTALQDQIAYLAL